MSAFEANFESAVLWLRAQSGPIPNVIHTIRTRFHLTAFEACEVCRIARENLAPSMVGARG